MEHQRSDDTPLFVKVVLPHCERRKNKMKY